MVTLFTVFDRWQSGFISFVKKILYIIEFDYIILEQNYIPKKKNK